VAIAGHTRLVVVVQWEIVVDATASHWCVVLNLQRPANALQPSRTPLEVLAGQASLLIQING